MTEGEATTDHVARSIELAWALLHPDRSGVALEEAAADPAPERIAARAGFGAVVSGCDVRLSVYVFDGWGGGQDYALAVQRRADEPGRMTRVAMNGSLLLIATGARRHPSEYVLNDLCSAFTGAE